MKKVLFIVPYYLPGYRSGGPQRTVENIVDMFGSLNQIYILTRDHDMGTNDIYPNIKSGWNRVGSANVAYAGNKEYTVKKIVECSESMDMVYACSLFSSCTIKAIISKKSGLLKCPLMVASMGVFSDGAIRQKSFKKKAFLCIFKALGMFKNIKWSFSSEAEKKDAENYLGKIPDYIIAEDLPSKVKTFQRRYEKTSGELKVIFLSRICQTKNLLKCLEILNTRWNGKIFFDIYGTREDSSYWEKCQELIKELNITVNCNYCGEIESSKAAETFSSYDVFLFPTLGENFGHVIFEALSSGCVPVISDKTIWNDIEKEGCGRIVPLDDTDKFRENINEFLKMNNDEFKEISDNAVRYAENKYRSSIEENGYSEIFD